MSVSDKFPDEAWACEVISGLREALKFYADETNYEQGWRGARRQRTLVDIDNGKIARAALLPTAKVASSGS